MGQKGMQTLMQILEAKNQECGEDRHEVMVYPGAKHGFAVRGDRRDPLMKEGGDKSEDQAVRWFQRWFDA